MNRRGLRWGAYLVGLLWAGAAGSVELRFPEGEGYGASTLEDEGGHPIGQGSLTQWTDDGKLYVKAVSDMGDRHIVEQGVFRLQPELIQDRWMFEERQAGRVIRRFDMDFPTGRASSQRVENGKVKRWAKHFDDLVPGKTFAGLGFVFAIKHLAPVMVKHPVELTAVAFTPEPRTAMVSLQYKGNQILNSSGRSIATRHFVIHPEIGLARIFVHVPDHDLWFTRTDPGSIIRARGPIADPSVVIQTDVIPEPTRGAVGREAPARR